MCGRNSWLAICVLALSGCALVDLERLELENYPSGREELVPASGALWVRFPEEPRRESAEKLLSVSSPSGVVAGDLRWEGRTLLFDPEPDLDPGVRYLLSYSGTVSFRGGRHMDANVAVPFYAGSMSPRPVLLSADPPDGAFVATFTTLRFEFSKAMDALKFERLFKIEPSTEFDATWDSDSQIVTVAPKEGWRNLATYAWTLPEDLPSDDGVAMGCAREGSFRVQEDATAPTVVSLQPAMKGDYSPLPPPLSAARADDAILVRFSEDVDADSLASAFSLSPRLSGSLRRLAPATYVYVPEGRFAAGQRYVLKIGTELEDLAGNKMALPYEEIFSPNVPFQRLLFLRAIAPEPAREWSSFNRPVAEPIELGMGGTLSLELSFELPYAPSARGELPLRITFEGFFPSTAADPSLVSALWPDARTLVLSYAGLAAGAAGAPNHYRFTVPGGAQSPDNGEGSTLEEETWICFSAE
jgi:hypothetical protein